MNIMPVLRLMMAVAFLSLFASTGYAGIDVSLSEELQRLDRLQRELPRNSAEYARLQEQRRKLERFLSLPEHLRYQQAKIIVQLQREIKHLEDSLERLADQPRFFSAAKNRVAVFTLDDPDNTGIGDAISFLISKALLFSAPVSSYGIVNYQSGVEQPDDNGRSYYDKVEKITEGQAYLFSIWGKISANKNTVTIEIFGQIDNRLDPFYRRVRLPQAMGGGSLTARVNANRFKIQTIRLSRESLGLFGVTSEQVRTLRAEPSRSSPVVDTLTEGKVHVIVSGRGPWVELAIQGGERGWTSVEEYCFDECKQLLTAVRYTNNFIAMTSNQGRLQQTPDVDHRAANAKRQLAALGSVDRFPVSALKIARGESPETGYASIRAIAEIAIELERRGTETRFDEIRLEQSFVRDVADQLARASLATPKDLDILANLVVLFDYLEDYSRRDLALRISESIRK